MKTHQLGRQIGTDSNFVHATHTGHSNKNVKAVYSPGDVACPEPVEGSHPVNK